VFSAVAANRDALEVLWLFKHFQSRNEQDLANLFDEVKKARWSSAADVKRSYAKSCIVL
jgi:mRNA-degrading endonuclease HigB of HigAB toxin-antitoxin module